MFSLKGKTALVTGASSGIGLGILRVLQEAGAEVVGCGRRPEGEAALPPGSIYHRCDISSPREIEALAAKIGESLDKLDILVSNAGANVFKGVMECSEADWSHNLNLNLASHWRVSRALRPLLLNGENPVIQVMSSNHAFQTITGCFPYNVAKTALLGLVRSMALELAPEIRVIGLAPGYIETEGTAAWFSEFPDPEKERRRTVGRHPLRTLGSAEQVGGLAAFLSTPYAGFITGETIVMDGGRTALLQERDE